MHGYAFFLVERQCNLLTGQCCWILILPARQIIAKLGGGKLYAEDMSTSGGAYLMGPSGIGFPDLVGSRYPGSMIGVQSSEIHLMTPNMQEEIPLGAYPYGQE